jgi:MoaA/NifB/PqqE/SkfB family radical SAM enzyme
LEERLTEMPFLSNIGLIMTYKCQVRCPHCILDAGPHRTEEVQVTDARDWIKQISAYHKGTIYVLSLTGGEPFYDVNKLRVISDYADSLGLYVSAVTNAYWASSAEKAAQVLKEVPAIRMFSVSTDVYHQQFIPFSNVQHAVQAMQTAQIPYTVSVCTENDQDAAYQKILQQIRQITTEEKIFTAITFPVGRAFKNVDPSRYPVSSEPSVSACAAGSSPILFPDGRVVACIGPVIDIKSPHALMLGNLREESLQEILDRAQINPLLHAIRVWGPKKLVQLLQEAGYGHLLPEVYVGNSVCSACYQLFSNPELNDLLMELTSNDEFMRTIAYARVYYLNEAQMVNQLQLVG